MPSWNADDPTARRALRRATLAALVIVGAPLASVELAHASPRVGVERHIDDTSHADETRLARRGRRRPPAPAPAPVNPPPPAPVEDARGTSAEPVPPPASPASTSSAGAAEAELEARRSGPSRIEFDDRLIQGQTNKANAIYLFERRASELRTLVRTRKHYHKEIDESVR